MCTMKENIFFSKKTQTIGKINAVLAVTAIVTLLCFWIIDFIYYLSFHSHGVGMAGLFFVIPFLLFVSLPAFLGFIASFVAWVLFIVKLTKNFIQSKHNPTLRELIFSIGISILTIIAILYLFTHTSTFIVLICATLFLFLVASLGYKKELSKSKFILAGFAYCFPAIIIIASIIWGYLFDLTK